MIAGMNWLPLILGLTVLAALAALAAVFIAAVRRRLREEMRAGLAEMRRELTGSLDASGRRTAEALGGLKVRLQAIDKAQSQLADMSQQVISLQDMLSNRPARGAFGEIQLRDLVSAALPEAAYAFAPTLSNARRPDCLIRLPRPPGPIVIDAKFPLEAYERLRQAGDDSARQAARRQMRQDLRKHISDIAARYILPGETAEAALMFVPSEAVYAEIHGHFRACIEEGFRARVYLASPTTLMALLNTVRAVLKDVRMREAAGLIQTELARLMKEVEKMAEAARKLARHFRLSEEDVGEITSRAENIAARAERIQNVEVAPPAAPTRLTPDGADQAPVP